MSQHPLPHGRHQQHLLIPSTKTIYQEKQRTQKRDLTPHKSYRTALAYVKIKTLTLFQGNPQNMQNSGLREVDLKPSPKKGSDKINMPK